MRMNRSRERLVPRRASRRLVWAVSLVGLAMAAGALAQGRYGGSDDQAAAPTPAMGASSGVFTAEQAERGAAVFTSSCAGCHGPQGIAALWDARFETPLSQQGVVLGELANQRDYFDLYGLANPFVVEPGNAQNSILFIRDHSVDPDDRMPQLAKNLPDETYLEVLEQWIDSLVE